jgi:hypothetical protein
MILRYGASGRRRRSVAATYGFDQAREAITEGR